MTYSASRGPLTITGAAVHGDCDPVVQKTVDGSLGVEESTSEGESDTNSRSCRLKVMKLESLETSSSEHYVQGQTHVSAFASVGYVNPAQKLVPPHSHTAFLRQGGSDCILSIQSRETVPVGVIVLTELQRHNLHLVDQAPYDFSLFAPPLALTGGVADILLEARLLHPETEIETETGIESGTDTGAGAGAGGEGEGEGEREGVGGGVVEREGEGNGEGKISVSVPTFDGVLVKKLLGKQGFGRVVAVGEMLVLFVDGRELAFRVAETNNLDEDERMSSLMYHCYRGLLTPDTRIHLKATESVHLSNNTWEGGKSSTGHLINVYTSDDEFFPVKKTLLRPCIALTKAVQDRGPEAPTVRVGIECAIFDRMLLYLEAKAMGRVEKFDFDINLNEAMLDAAHKLGLRGAIDLCERKMGDFHSRIREYSLCEIRERNGRGECWLIIDCMVLDVTKWLPEHPGGNSIIPEQALNVDCACFFELYHVSRESFLYLKHFYMGELKASDRELVPTGEVPSDEFLQQLRDYSDFRMHQKDFISL